MEITERKKLSDADREISRMFCRILVPQRTKEFLTALRDCLKYTCRRISNRHSPIRTIWMPPRKRSLAS